MTHGPHLTEDERHELADGSLAPEKQPALLEHIRACDECSADVDRIRSLMKRVRESSPSGATGDEAAELWPAIRDRIDERKVVAMPGATGSRASARRGWLIGIAGVAAAGIIGLWLLQPAGSPPSSNLPTPPSESSVSLIAIVDSTHAYEEEAQSLLNHLELQRATLRPELSRALERDLRTIDVAIAELQTAIRNDPANPALRRLLASSYRQKVDLLKRVDNAG